MSRSSRRMFTSTSPPESDAAVSAESVRRWMMSGRTIRRSTTISMLCFWFLLSLISSVRSYMLPSTRTRA